MYAITNKGNMIDLCWSEYLYPLYRSIAISAKTDPNAGESIKVKDGVLHNVGVAYVARKSIGIDTLLVQFTSNRSWFWGC